MIEMVLWLTELNYYYVAMSDKRPGTFYIVSTAMHIYFVLVAEPELLLPDNGLLLHYVTASMNVFELDMNYLMVRIDMCQYTLNECI